MNIQIGKHTLETLTLGLYVNPMDLYREYIQNSIDSIDEAYKNRIISPKEEEIEIFIDKRNRIISVSDNGIGIKEKEAAAALIDIGNSNKSIKKQRGFRGIGRLIGINCSERVTFETTYPGESTGTEVIFDSKKMREIMIPGQYDDYDIVKTLATSLTHTNFKSNSEEHYFKVTLEGVHNLNNILDIKNVKDYLLQVAPIPYDQNIFSWGNKIEDALSIVGKPLDSYNISIRTINTNKDLLKKLYSDNFWVSLSSKTIDEIKGITIKEIKDQKDELIALLWYSNSNYLGTIHDKRMKGLRLRQGNLLIGNHGSANQWFKEDRFNGWFQGEIFILNEKIIPNARRDDFELNELYMVLSNNLKELGGFLSKEIRMASQNRNRGKSELSDLDDLFDIKDNNKKYTVLNLVRKEYSKKELLEITFDTIYDNLGEEAGSTLINKVLNKIT